LTIKQINLYIDKTCKLFTLLYIYQDVNGQHEAICHSLNEKDLRNEGKYNSFMQTINAMNEGKEFKLDDSRATFRYFKIFFIKINCYLRVFINICYYLKI
jgi:hypothetical protein